MKSGKIVFAIVLLALGVVIFVNKCGKEKAVAPRGSGGQPLLATGIVVAEQDIQESIYASGTILAEEEVEIRNEVAGRITSILFKEGSRVNKGDLLLTIYDEDLLARLKKLKYQRDIVSATEERHRDLLVINGVSKQEYELSLNELNAIKADIELLESEIGKTKIRAPFNGIVGLKSVSTGSYLPANTRIATIQSTDLVKLEFGIPERYRPLMGNGEIRFTTESAEGTFTGKIYAYEPKIDLQTRSILVRAISKNEGMKLIPGAFANIEVPLKKIDNALMIPSQAIVPELKGQSVFTLKNGKAAKAPVETGVRNDTTIQIVSGLKTGDTVLVTGIMQARPGMPVNVSVQ